uniref:RNA polymerase factor sigma-54 n=1 Tax=Leisingera sp. TaxID=1879318 RepID=UPI002B26D6AC
GNDRPALATMARGSSALDPEEGGMGLGFHLRASQAQVFKLGQVVGVLQMSSGDLEEHLAETAQENPMLILRPRLGTGSSATDVLEMTSVEEASSLYDHVFRELAGLMAQGGMLEKLVTLLIEELEPSGWLGCPLDEIAGALGITGEVAERALRLIQKRIEPTGLFARNLEECLRLQLEDQEAMTGSMCLVLDHLGVLESGGTGELVKKTGLDETEVAHCLAMIRGLNPKPGSAFVFDPTLLREPDVTVTSAGDGWEIEFRSALQPDVTISPVPRGAQNPAMQEALAKARALKQALELRRSALKQVVGVLVQRQDAFFRTGPEALHPMTMSEISRETGFHLSTVSRVLNGLLIEGPNGIIAARALCAGACSIQNGHSKPKVQARIRSLLAAEDPRKPFSDRQLTVMLEAEGIGVSRRVVAKYRQENGLAPAAKRRLRN